MSRQFAIAPLTMTTVASRRSVVAGIRDVASEELPSFSREELEQQLMSGQRARRAIRLRVSGALLLAGVVVLTVGQAWNVHLKRLKNKPSDPSDGKFHVLYSDIETEKDVFCVEQVFAVELDNLACLLINSAPLQDDVLLARFAVCFYMLPKAISILMLATFMKVVPFWEDDHDPKFVPVIATNILMVCSLLFALFRHGAHDVQRAIWRTLQIYYTLWLIYNLFRLCAHWSGYLPDLRCTWHFMAISACNLFLASWPGWRYRFHSLLIGTIDRHGATVAAASVAGLLGSASPAAVIAKSTTRFRCIFPGDLRKSDMENCDPDPALYNLSVPARLGFCDAFVSHSWSDDANGKWVALQDWCDSFRALHKREPSLWIDKFCIDQTDIVTDLQCLPVYLCGCKEMLVFCGTTYTSRLWCIMELFTHHHIGLADHKLTMIPVFRDGNEEEDRYSIASAIRDFDVEESHCSNRRDGIKMIEIVYAAYGNNAVFNDVVRNMSVFADILVDSDDVSWHRTDESASDTS